LIIHRASTADTRRSSSASSFAEVIGSLCGIIVGSISDWSKLFIVFPYQAAVLS